MKWLVLFVAIIGTIMFVNLVVLFNPFPRYGPTMDGTVIGIGSTNRQGKSLQIALDCDSNGTIRTVTGFFPLLDGKPYLIGDGVAFKERYNIFGMFNSNEIVAHSSPSVFGPDCSKQNTIRNASSI